MKALLDTNILLRIRDRAEPEHAAVLEAVDGLLLRDFELCYCDQNIVEMWSVLTRARDTNGYELPVKEARRQIDELGTTFTHIGDPRNLMSTWLRLVTTNEVRGRKSFDARLVALMLGSEISHIVTLNPKDFVRFPEVQVVVPGST